MKQIIKMSNILRSINTRLFIGITVMLVSCSPVEKNIRLGKSTNQEVIAAMTLDEKAQLLVGDDPGFPRGYPSGFGGADTLFDSQPPVVGQTRKLVPGAAGTTFAIPRLGIPAIVLADGPAGVRIDPVRQDTSKTFYATAFPIESLLACSWDTALVRQVGVCMGTEAKEYGVDILLGPALNIHRNPLGGRNFEYYSEDPVVSGEMAAAMVNGVQSVGVGTSIKHFAANNNETNRMSIDATIDEKTLHEIYLKGFEIAVKKSNPWTVMSAYNKINGIYCSENPVLLDSILRKDWGFSGFVMTDWFAGRDRIQQVRVGNDLQMPGSKYIAQKIAEAVKSGELDESVLDRNIDRILTIIKQSPRFLGYKYSNDPDLKAHAKVAAQAAVDGMVLLTNNDNTLPLDKAIHKIAAFGIGSFETISRGTGSGNVNSAYTVSIKRGLENSGYLVPAEFERAYTDHIKDERQRIGQKKSYFDPDIMLQEKNWSASELNQFASEFDIALFTISRTSGEFADRQLNDDFQLTDIEQEMIGKLSKAFHAKGKKLLVVLNVGGVIETASWKNEVDAILLAWQPGQEAGNAIAQILSGEVTPSGKLTMSFPVKYDDVPSADCFPDAKLDPKTVDYKEGIGVGYRHYTANAIPCSFEFGFGLSYTSFKYSNLKVQSDSKHTFLVELTVTNMGKVAGKEVVQLYTRAKEEKMIQLKHFAKTALLNPGESAIVKFELSAEDLAGYVPNLKAWVAEAGTYEVLIGASSTDSRLSTTITLGQSLQL